MCAGKAAPTKIIIMPDGVNRLANGPNLTMDADSAAVCIAAFDEQGVQLPIDFEHSTIGKGSDGDAAPATGWVTSMYYEEGKGLIGTVEWTDEGAEMVSSGKYKYLSPVLFTEGKGKDLKIVKIHSMALTNKPRIKNHPGVMAARQTNNGQRMIAASEHDLEVLLPMLAEKLRSHGYDIPGGATAAALIELVMEILEMTKPATTTEKPAATATSETLSLAQLRETLGLGVDADAAIVLSEVNKLRGHVGYVKASDHLALADRLKAIETKQANAAAEQAVSESVMANKLNPFDEKQMTWAHDFARKDPGGFELIMASAPAIVPAGRTQSGGGKVGGVAKEDQLIADALKENGNNYGKAMVALQVKLKEPYLEQGLTQKAANAACAAQYPKVFSA